MKIYTFKKYSPVMIDRTAFDFKGIDFTYNINKSGDIEIIVSDKDLVLNLDKYHYEYLQECTNGKIIICKEYIADLTEEDTWDFELYKSFKYSIK
tara:strand:+ start:687 stop:971 length:285 start_codon:yes stop_codon:yes gene_type:complete